MTVLTSKICVVGDFAVGKTSVVERYVNNQFSEKYLTTVGVKIDTKEIEASADGVAQKLVIWDVAGTDRFGATEFAYLRGAAGYLYVADGTRAPTLQAAQELRLQIEEQYGRHPGILLLNKHDLAPRWDISAARIDAAREKFDALYLTSAKSGEAVQEAIVQLAEMIADRALRGTS